MNRNAFLISSKFLVEPQRNLIYTNYPNLETYVHVEPRVMKVLMELMHHAEEVVSREYLIEKVWNNYGGADEALSQVVSRLRKVFDDNDRQHRIIKTIPKQGYSIHFVEIKMNRVKAKKKIKKSFLVYGLLLVFLGIVFSYTFSEKNTSHRYLAPKPAHHKSRAL